MIRLLNLSKLILFVIIFTFITHKSLLAENEAADIWAEDETLFTKETTNSEEDIKIESPILSDDITKLDVKINEDEIKKNDNSVIGIFDPEENNFNLKMWEKADGDEIKKVLKRIDKLKLSNLSEELLFKILFTNAYPPKNNLNNKEFLKIKIDWLIAKKRPKDLEVLLKTNPEVGKNSKAIKYLINEYLSTSDIKSACNKIEFIDKKLENNYLDKFTIYCLIHRNRKEEAQLVYDLLNEKGFKDKFFEDKINFLLGINETTSQKILDNDLLNFYFSYITNDNFNYQPTDSTDKYIWKFLSSNNLIQVNDFEDENVVISYEQAAAQNTFNKDEIFKIYLKMQYNFNQLVNAKEIYKNLPNYKARALIYQSLLLTEKVENKIDLAFLLKELFVKDKILSVYSEELSEILKSINYDEIPKNYVDLVDQNLKKQSSYQVKFDNNILHRSKIIKHFLDDNEKLNKTEKDFKSVYKKIKKNKKYFISIMDIVVLESLEADGISLPKDLKYKELSSQLTVPQYLQDLVNENQLGLVMLKIVEIIGEDNVRDLDPETLYFLNRIFNQLNLKKIRNNILSSALPVRS